MLERGEIPEHVLAVSAWPAPVPCALGDGELSRLPRLTVLPRHTGRHGPRSEAMAHPTQPREAETSAPDDDRDALAHYLLVHIPEDPAFMGVWSCQSVIAAAVDYVERYRPTIGFSAAEARRARHVTLVGPDSLSLGNVAGLLRGSAASLDLIPAASPRDLKRALDERVASGMRFAK
jgi:hypothetical protein